MTSTLEADVMDKNDAEDRKARIMTLVETTVMLNEEISLLESRLKATKAVREMITDNMLPELIRPAKAVTLPDGTKVTVKNSWHGSITDANREAAIEELVRIGREDLIRTEIRILFSPGEYQAVREFLNAMAPAMDQFPFIIEQYDEATFEQKQNFLAIADTLLPERKLDVRETVHPSTLKSFIKSQFAKGADWKPELFGAFERITAVISTPEGETLAEAEAEG